MIQATNGTTPPSPRDRHCAVVHGNAFYVFGGFDGGSRVNDFYKFDILSETWEVVVPNVGEAVSELPTPRHSHSAVVYKDTMVVFGGYDGSYRCDLYEYNFLTGVWRMIHAVGRIPRARYRATCVVHGNEIVLYGGHDGTRHLSDTHVFSFRTEAWKSLTCSGTPPMNRDSHIGVVYGNGMYVFAGSAGGTAMNDLFELLLDSTGEIVEPEW